MPKIHYVTSNGTKVTIEGTSVEVGAIAERLQGDVPRSVTIKKEVGLKNVRKAKSTPINLLCELIDGGFFKKPKELGSIKVALEEQGHFYPVTTLSPSLLRLVRKKQLRRIKDHKRWLYVN